MGTIVCVWSSKAHFHVFCIHSDLFLLIALCGLCSSRSTWWSMVESCAASPLGDTSACSVFLLASLSLHARCNVMYLYELYFAIGICNCMILIVWGFFHTLFPPSYKSSIRGLFLTRIEVLGTEADIHWTYCKNHWDNVWLWDIIALLQRSRCLDQVMSWTPCWLPNNSQWSYHTWPRSFPTHNFQNILNFWFPP